MVSEGQNMGGMKGGRERKKYNIFPIPPWYLASSLPHVCLGWQGIRV